MLASSTVGKQQRTVATNGVAPQLLTTIKSTHSIIRRASWPRGHGGSQKCSRWMTALSLRVLTMIWAQSYFDLVITTSVAVTLPVTLLGSWLTLLQLAAYAGLSAEVVRG